MCPPARKPWRPRLCRKKAEALLTMQDRPLGTLAELSALRLVHELQVHQIELELQNEELIETREELITVLAEYTNLYDLAPVGLLTLDADGLIRRANLMAGSLLGVYRGRLQGRSFPRLLDAPSRRRFLEHVAEPVSENTPRACELALLPAEGAVTWIRVEEIIPGANQERLIALTDITERHQAQRLQEDQRVHLEVLLRERTGELQVRTGEYADLWNQAPCGYDCLDREGNVIAMNDTELQMLGYTREEVVGRLHIRDLLTETSWALFQKVHPEFLRTGHLRHVEADFRRKDGSEFPALVSSDAKLDSRGRFLHSLSTVVDNTLGKEVERKLHVFD
jgi:PAS domain S-box-containing protein